MKWYLEDTYFVNLEKKIVIINFERNGATGGIETIIISQ